MSNTVTIPTPPFAEDRPVATASAASPAAGKPDRAGAPILPAIATAICAAATVTAWLLRDEPAGTAAFVVAYIAGGAGATTAALVALGRAQLTVDLLMILAAAGAAAIGEPTEGAVLLFLFSLSGTLESYAMYRTRASIDSLIRLRPREAMLVRNGETGPVPVESLRIDDVVLVRPGERFAVDGEITDGNTWANESTITGESAPVTKSAGDAVFAGTVNGAGAVRVRMTRAVEDTTLERIVRLVQEAQAEKTPTQQFIEAWQGPYVIGVLTAALATFAAGFTLHHADFDDAFYRAMVMLVAASPCALVIGPPAAVLSAIARAARGGVLFKGGAHLETLGAVTAIAFDKTGTITVGRPSVVEIRTPAGVDADRLLALAAAVEARSEHHLAEAVLAEAKRRGLTWSEVTEFESHTGLGVHGHVGGVWVGVGREALFSSHDVTVPAAVLADGQALRAAGHTSLLVVTTADGAAGVIALSDRLRSEAKEALADLRRLGVRRTVMLTGDHQNVAQSVAAAVGADEFLAGLLPDQKVVELKRLKREGEVTAMVGDGVNDAPALATADVGIAMGGAGTDVALETADVVLMRDNLAALPFAVRLARRARGRIKQNVALGFASIAALVLASFFGLPLWTAVIGHEGTTVLVIANGLRLLWERG
jgi:Cd2+/Zn2+-exporting ATPase